MNWLARIKPKGKKECLTHAAVYIMILLYVKLTLQTVLYKSLFQLTWDSTLGDKPRNNLANVRAESITRPGYLIPRPLARASEQ